MSTKTKVAAIQMASGPNVSANLIEVERLICLSVEAGSSFVVLPENFAIMGMAEQDKVLIKETYGQGKIQDFLAEQAAKHSIWLVGGTVPLEANDPNKIRAASLLFNDQGECVLRYDKIHLFDVHIEESRENYVESETIESGDKVVAETIPCGRLGITVCYDLRFPEIFRMLSKDSVTIIAIPAAFTAITGKAHWEYLVRARAIENLCYVIAAGQGGYHVNGRETYGHSMIVDPWGVVLDCLPHGSGFVIAEIDQDHLKTTRQHFPALNHRKLL